MTSDEMVKYWVDSAEDNYRTMKNMFNSSDYTWCLFLGHLVVEKLLKGMYAKNNVHNPFAPKSHDLVLLASKCGIELDENKEKMLYTITSFNISARYEDYKNSFKKKCTKDYTQKQINNIEEMRKWLLEMI